MADAPVLLSCQTARRLAIVKQHLAGKKPKNPRAASIMSLMHDIRYVQLDPTNVVAPSHLLVLWSRLGAFKLSDLDSLQWKEKMLFEYWAHQASIVLTEDYPLYRLRMKRFATADTLWPTRLREWMKDNSDLRKYMLGELRARGPYTSRDFEDKSESRWKHARRKWGLRESGWSTGRDTSRMLEFLFHLGEILVAGRQGRQKLWDLPERVLPDWTPMTELSSDETEHLGTQLSLKALGAATPKQISWHFLMGRYPNLKKTLGSLESDGKVARAKVKDLPTKRPWFIHSDDLDAAESIAAGEYEPRTTLLSPFDNLITDRDRTHELFDFFYRIEIYTPKEKRKHGFFVLPILDGDRIVGRMDPAMDRQREELRVNAVYAEPGAPRGRALPRRIADAVADLGSFLGAKKVVYSGRVPEEWRAYLK
ncbi:MAG TPA: crosslink repair DNA glycosylase YcaQ family protein [Nitrososphaerales archaeon]